jgi:peptidylprolyl isomerase
VPSSRRQRELARQRYERRRQEAERRRARQRRRNAVIASVLAVLLVLGGAAYGVSLLVGDDDKKTAAQPTPTATTQPTPPPAAPTKCAAIKPNPPKAGQPKIPPVTGTAPTKLVVKDVKKGTGAAAKQGSAVSVTYIGASCSTGTVFDASYLHGGEAFEVKPLGSASVIAGWNQGLIGVRAGGVRELVIPAALGYGEQGQGPIKPNETLIFLITVKSVKA